MTIKYYFRWEGKDTNGEFIKGELEVKSKLGEAFLEQLIVLETGKIILKEMDGEINE